MIGAPWARGEVEQVPAAADVLAQVRAHARERGDGLPAAHAADVRYEVALDLLHDATGYYLARLREVSAAPGATGANPVREQLAIITEVRDWLHPADTATVDAAIAHYGELIRSQRR